MTSVFGGIPLEIKTYETINENTRNVIKMNIKYGPIDRSLSLSFDLPYIEKIDITGVELPSKYIESIKKILMLLINYMIARKNNLINPLLPKNIESVLEFVFVNFEDLILVIKDEDYIPLKSTGNLDDSYIELINITGIKPWVEVKKLSRIDYTRYLDSIKIVITLIHNYLVARKNGTVERLVPESLEKELPTISHDLTRIIILIQK